MRDIENYADRYVVQGFESYKVQYRRRKILEIIKKYQKAGKHSQNNADAV